MPRLKYQLEEGEDLFEKYNVEGASSLGKSLDRQMDIRKKSMADPKREETEGRSLIRRRRTQAY